MARKSRKTIQVEASAKPAVLYIRTAMYIRLSVEDNHSKGNSLDNQQLIIQDYLTDKPEFQIVGAYIDNGLSGMSFDRPDFQRLLADIEAGRVDCVIVKDLSRLGRNFIDTSYYIEQYFSSRNIRFIAVTDQFDTAAVDPLRGGIILPLKNMINEAYAVDIGKKIKAQAHQAMLDGAFIGARPPYGYMKDPEDCHKLIVDENTAPTVRQIFQWASDGVGISQIVLQLNEAGVQTPGIYKQENGESGKQYRTGKGKWQTWTVGRILANPVYTGDMVQGKTKTVDHVQRPADPSHYICVSNTHPALVSHELFDAVQAIRQSVRNESKARSIVPYTPNIFKGKVFCAHCGTNLHRQRDHGKSGKDAYYFHCLTNTRIAHGACPGVSIHERELNKTLTMIVEKELTAMLGGSISALRQEKEYQEQRKAIVRQLAAKRSAQDKARNMIRCLYEDLASGTLRSQDYSVLKADIEEQGKRVSDEIAALENDLSMLDERYKRRQALKKDAYSLADSHTLTAELVSSLFTRIEISHDREFRILFSFRDDFTQEGRICKKT